MSTAVPTYVEAWCRAVLGQPHGPAGRRESRRIGGDARPRRDLL